MCCLSIPCDLLYGLTLARTRMQKKKYIYIYKGKTNTNKLSSAFFPPTAFQSMDPVHREQQRHQVDADGLPLGCGELARGENMENASCTKCCGTHHIMQGSLVPR